jgi:CheY-like chemotaxis protein
MTEASLSKAKSMKEQHSLSNSPDLSSPIKLNSILLIEDDEITNFYNTHLIRKLGICPHVHVELNGRTALQYLTEKEAHSPDYHRPDLILLDINMPVMNGFEFLEAYGKIPAEDQSGQLIIMLTSSMLEVDRNRARQYRYLGDYYPKPLTETQLREIVARYFS